MDTRQNSKYNKLNVFWYSRWNDHYTIRILFERLSKKYIETYVIWWIFIQSSELKRNISELIGQVPNKHGY